jgi:RHH-type proline utilization regulon transcriptional repressor/proline dehydrogenase/delta 1-pyrroline-5-carboxylate dehydrogenase
VLDGVVNDLLLIAHSALTQNDYDALYRSACSDENAMREHFGSAHDESGLGGERNVLRYAPSGCVVYLGPDATPFEWWRALIAWVRTPGNPVGYAHEIPVGLNSTLGLHNKNLVAIAETELLSATQHGHDPRLRLVGASANFTSSYGRGDVTLALYDQPVTEAGRIELLPYFKEQAVSITAHRFGNPVPWVKELAL